MQIPNYPVSEVQKQQAEEGFEPGRWWQAIDEQGRLLAETSSRSDFQSLNLVGREGVTFRRIYEKRETKWVDENPFPEEKL